MKRSETFFSVLLVPLDYVFVVLAGLSAYGLRFTTFSESIPVQFELALGDFAHILFPVAFGFIIVFGLSGLYTIRLDSKKRGELVKVFLASTAAVAIFIFVIFFRQELFASRFIILATWILTVLYVGIERILIRFIQYTLLRRGLGARHLVLLTSEDDKHKFKQTFNAHPEFGYIVESHITRFDEDAKRIIHSLNQQERVDELLISDGQLQSDELLELIEFCTTEHIVFRYTADLLPVPVTHFEQTTLAGVPIIELKRTRLEGWGKVWKRIFDIILSIIVFIITSPLIVIGALGITITSPGKIFVSLTRVGEKGKIFSMYKLRSMVPNADRMKQELEQYNERTDGPLFKIKNDPRITPFGMILRKTSIDELPQLWNVLKGDMSMVGPRPHEPQEVAKYTPYQKKLLTIKPGMSGMAQISGRSDLRFSEEAQLDIFYIENWSLMLDMRIIVKTPRIILFRKGSA